MASSKPLPLIPWRNTSLLTARFSKDAAHLTQRTALDIFVLGYPEQANRLLGAFFNAANGFDFYHVGNRRPLYDAWQATGTTPAYITDPPPDKTFDGFDTSTEEGRNGIKKSEESWKDGYPKSPRTTPEGDLNSVLELLGEPEKRIAKPKVTVGIAVQIALLNGDEPKARALIEKHVVNLYRYLQNKWNDGDPDEESLYIKVDPRFSGSFRPRMEHLRKWLDDRLGIQHGPRMWPLLAEGIVGRALEVDEQALDAFVNEGCELIEERFTKGPVHPHANKSIPELLEILDDNMDESDLNEASTFLKPPATEQEIRELEEQLVREENDNDNNESGDDASDSDSSEYEQSQKPDTQSQSQSSEPFRLPEDYKAFLQFSNGLYNSDPDDQSGIFYGSSAVSRDGVDWIQDLEYTLFLSDSVPDWPDRIDSFDLISLGDFKGFNIGAGGDEGQIVLIDPSSVKAILERFEQAYAAASERDKRIYERAAVDTYGGIEKLRKLEWLLIVCYHWDPDERIYGGFRAYLESIVGNAQEKREEKEEESEPPNKKQKRDVGDDEEDHEEIEEESGDNEKKDS